MTVMMAMTTKVVVRKESASNAGSAGKAGSADSKFPNLKATIRPDLRGEISGADGENLKMF